MSRFRPIRKACTFRASSIGDCLMGKYVLEQIHAAYPRAQCTLVVASHGTMIRDLCAAYPWLSIREASRRTPWSLITTFFALWGTDATITQYSGRGTFSTTSKIFARLTTKIGGLVGFSDAWKWNRYIYDYLLPYVRDMVFLKHDQAALEVLGVSLASTTLSLVYVHDSDVLNRFKLRAKQYICLHLFAGTEGRGLTEKNYRAYVQEAVTTFGNEYTIVLTGSTKDILTADALALEFPVTSIVGKTTLQELANVLVHSRGVVSVDTGVAHMAAQLSVPIVVVGTCLASQWWSAAQYPEGATFFSREDLCVGGHVSDKAHNCLNSVDVTSVIQTAYTRMHTPASS